MPGYGEPEFGSKSKGVVDFSQYRVRDAGWGHKGGTALLRALVRPYMTINSPNLEDSIGGATHGPISFVHPDASQQEVEHEQRHGQQFYVPGWTALRLVEMMYPYGKGPLELDANRAAGIPVEANEGLVNSLAQKYVRAFIGK